MTIAVFPGSFDPLTSGHVDVIARACQVFDRIIVAVVLNPAKDPLFTPDERVDLILSACGEAGLPVTAAAFPGLLVDFVKDVGARVILRGLRAVSDYEYEAQMALTNRRLGPGIETYFLMATESYAYVSSSVVRQVARFGGDVSSFVPAPVAEALARKYAPLADPRR